MLTGGELLVLCAIIGVIPAAIASSRGHSFFAWWLFGAALFIIALPLSLMLKTETAELDRRAELGGMRKCPRCAEMVRAEAVVCRYCQSELTPLPPAPAVAAPVSTATTGEKWRNLFILLAVVSVVLFVGWQMVETGS